MENKKELEYYKKNAEEDYMTTPISVLRYITEMEQALNIQNVSNCDAIFEEASKFPDEDIECDATEADIY